MQKPRPFLSLLFPFLMLVCCPKAQGQNPATVFAEMLKGGSTTSTPSYSYVIGTKIDTARVHLRLHGVATANVDINFTINPPDLPDAPTLLTSKFTLSMARWNTGNDTILAIPLAFNNRDSSLAEDEVAYISLATASAGATNGYHTVRISSQGLYMADKPFWVEVGANVDLAERKVNNLFGGVFLYKRDWRKLFQSKPNSIPRLAIAAGIYESKAASTSLQNNADLSIQTYYDRTSLPPGLNDTIQVFTDTGKLQVKNATQNTGFFFSPQWRLTQHSANEDGIHFFASLYFELLWQHITSDFDYSGMVRKDTLPVLRRNINDYRGRANTQTHDFFAHYEGVGLPIFAKVGDANLYINPVFGISTQADKAYITSVLLSNDASVSSQHDQKWHPFYLIQFRLSEEKYGLSFSGEIRQLIGAHSDPYVTLVLSKKFNLQKLVEFF